MKFIQMIQPHEPKSGSPMNQNQNEKTLNPPQSPFILYPLSIILQKIPFILYPLSFILLMYSSTFAQLYVYEPNHPELKWESIETEHFLVHYHQGTARTANVVAEIAEDIYPAITGLYDYEPSSKVEFIIKDTQDYANGAAYFFDNKIEIWAENLDYVLRGTHNWLRDVITHEYIHIISLQKALKFGRKVPAGWFQVFGYEQERRQDVVRGFPDVLVSYPISGITVPVWFAEGVSQYQSNAKRFDYRDSHREMILRDRIMTGHLLTLEDMSVFGKNSIGNESSYNQGFAFVKYLAENYGEESLRKMAGAASAVTSLSFNRAMKKATGVPAKQLYRDWKASLEDTYTSRLQTIQANLHIGEPFVDEGIGNMHPRVSPDGKKIAYLMTGDSPYLSGNALVVETLGDPQRKKQMVAPRVTGSVSWSPDGRYLAYARITEVPETQALFNDLYLYDLEKKKEQRITRTLRARHPDWSHDGKRLAFVVESDGLLNLYTLTLDETSFQGKIDDGTQHYYDLNTHELLADIPAERRGDWREHYREVRFLGSELRQLTRYVDGRQFYHPRWSPKDDYLIFDTSIGFARDIARISPEGGEMAFVLEQRYDERYPTFHPASGELLYASDETGIYNIYSLNLENGEKKAYTNVIGGAFMPTMTPQGDLYYSLYRDQGYKLHHLPAAQAVPLAQMTYIDNYASRIPELSDTDQAVSESELKPAKPYKNRFPGVTFMPRALIDYGTLKLGSYIYTNELLDKMSFFGGGAVNLKKDYDLFAIFDYDVLKHKFFIEIFNQTANIQDTLSLPEYPTVFPEIDINFNLTQVNAGFETTALPWNLSKLFYTRLEYIFSFYRAKLGSFAFNDPVTNDLVQFAPFRYTYLRGHALSLLLRHENVQRDLDRGINPRKGRYISLRAQREWNRFLTDFATDSFVGVEEFDKFYFNRVEMNWEEYLPVPFTKHHSLTLRAQAGFIDTEVDSFFHFFAGGLVGLKGYPFYSIEGRKLAVGTATYRFPLLRNINKQFLNLHFDKLYLGGFVQAGNAWSAGDIEFDNFLTDVGVQLRLDTFSWYFFPTKIFFEAAYPLKEQINQGVRYPQEWKYYFGVLFDFDLRLEKRRF